MQGLFETLLGGGQRKNGDILSILPDFLRFGPSKSGQTVTYQTALQVSAVLACCQVLANGVAQVPWRVMQATSDALGAVPAPRHPLYKILNRRPNSYQTSFEFRQTLVLHLALARNAYVYVSRGSGGRILELIPLEPGRVTVTRQRDLSLSYVVTAEGGERSQPLGAREIWHIRGLSWNGWSGMDAVRLTREQIGLAMALEEAHSLLHANGVKPSGTWSVEAKLTPEQHTKLTKWIKESAAAAAAGNPLILDNGAKWLAQQMTGVDAEHLATRQFQVVETCRGMNVQPMMVFAVDKPTYNSAEQLFNAHLVHTLMPLYELIEQSADVNLLGVDDDTGFFTAFSPRGMMRGSLKDQADYYAKALGAGGSPAWMTQDEVRDDSDLVRMGGPAGRLREPSNVGAPAPITPSD